jgi:asparagine synthase (glutamine-hydrolysing)
MAFSGNCDALAQARGEPALMCGILGWMSVDLTGRRHDFAQALDTLSHRGPDDHGVFEADGLLLGHRRLSIIDLSTAGRQPMEDASCGNVITFNGEIYNYVEIRAELERLGHVFRTVTDTEVLLHAFREWGRDALIKLNGMWAFAIWQPATRTLFMARDRFGVKPFYYARTASGFMFASEPKALLCLAPELRRPDDTAIFDFLSAGVLHADTRSFYEGIHALPAGSCAQYRAQGKSLEIERYWDYPHASPAAGEAPDDAVSRFSDLFDDAVRLRMRSDVTVGLTLSGGLDSTAVLASAQRCGARDMVCLTSVYGGANRGESAWAAMASRPYGLAPVEVDAPRDHWLETLGDIAWHMDGPGFSPAVYPLWHLMKEARGRGVYVLLEGQGADEVLGGYPQYAAIALLAALRRARSPAQLSAVFESLRNAAGTFTGATILRWLLREQFPSLITVNRSVSGAASVLSRDFRQTVGVSAPCAAACDTSTPEYDPVTERLHLDHSRNLLPALLQYGDAVSMAHGVESRLPFMDYRLVEWLFSRGDDMKIVGGHTKWLLRRYLSNAGQEGIARRKDKLGYPTPIEDWLAGERGQLLDDLLLAPDARIRRYCDAGALKRLIARHVSGRKGSGNHLYRLVSLELWMRRCLN